MNDKHSQTSIKIIILSLATVLGVWTTINDRNKCNKDLFSPMSTHCHEQWMESQQNQSD